METDRILLDWRISLMAALPSPHDNIKIKRICLKTFHATTSHSDKSL